MPRMLDLFCGRLGVAKVFAERGWQVVAVDIVKPPSIPPKVTFVEADVLQMYFGYDGITIRRPYANFNQILGDFDFAWGSSVCDGFASFGMPHFRPNPPYPAMEIKLFNHTRQLFESMVGTLAGFRYVMENVKSAQRFVGPAQGHCGPFYLWGNAVPPIMPQGISKAKWTANRLIGRDAPGNFAPELNLPKAERKAKLATIPPELANCVADYAERLLEQWAGATPCGKLECK